MLSFVFPWSRIAKLERQLSEERTKSEALQRELNLQKLHRANSVSIISDMRDTIARGHFRNPATGRLGRRGQTFEGKKS